MIVFDHGFLVIFPRGNLNPFIGGYARSDRMALRANSEALPWEPVPEGLTNDIFGPYVPRQQLQNCQDDRLQEPSKNEKDG